MRIHCTVSISLFATIVCGIGVMTVSAQDQIDLVHYIRLDDPPSWSVYAGLGS